MKTFKQYVTELFNKPLEFEELPWMERNVIVYYFELDEKNYYRVFFRKSGRKNHYEITFDHLDRDSDIFLPYLTKTTVISGKNSIKVFSTVVAIVKDFLRKNKNVTGFLFTAADDSSGRKALYDRLSKNMAAELKWNYSVHSEDEAFGTVYQVVKYKAKK